MKLKELKKGSVDKEVNDGIEAYGTARYNVIVYTTAVCMEKGNAVKTTALYTAIIYTRMDVMAV